MLQFYQFVFILVSFLFPSISSLLNKFVEIYFEILVSYSVRWETKKLYTCVCNEGCWTQATIYQLISLFFNFVFFFVLFSFFLFRLLNFRQFFMTNLPHILSFNEQKLFEWNCVDRDGAFSFFIFLLVFRSSYFNFFFFFFLGLISFGLFYIWW